MAVEPEILLPGEADPRPVLGELELDRVERRLERLATMLDSAFAVPGTGIRFGADSIIGLVPGIGDVITLGLSGYLIMEARRLGAPASMVRKMTRNVAFDAVVGVVPLLGDAFDLFFKANKRNMALLRTHIAALRAEQARVVHPPQNRGAFR